MKYTRTHEWVEVKNGIAHVGITNHAQKELGDIVYVELPKIGNLVKNGDPSAVLESTKAAADFYSPVAGEIIEVNEKLKADSGLINRSPEQEGWIYKLKVSNMSSLEDLLNYDEYIALIK
jgi:glycine cleavage system H protein